MLFNRNDTMTLGRIASVLGCLTIFCTWVEWHHYDYYGYSFRYYDGISVMWCGLDLGFAAFIPILFAVGFAVSFFKFDKHRSERIFHFMLAMFIAVFLLDWYFNLCSNYWMDTVYYTEDYHSGYAGSLAVLLALANAVFGYMADNRLRMVQQPVYEPVDVEPDNSEEQERIALTTMGGNRFCPNCGKKLYDRDNLAYCPGCGKFLGDRDGET